MLDPYVLPNGTLKNLLGLDSQTDLDKAEEQLTRPRVALLIADGMSAPFSFETVKSVHKFVFSAVYDWAGIPRITTLSKGRFVGDRARTEFTHPAFLERDGARLFERLAGERSFTGLKAPEFADRSATFLSELNTLHPFREGNGRTQRITLRMIAVNAGHDLDFSVISKERNIQASIAASEGDLKPLRWMLMETIDAGLSTPLRNGIRALDAAGFDWNDRHLITAEPGATYHGVLAGRNAADSEFMMHDSAKIIFGATKYLADDAARGSPVTVRVPEIKVSTAPHQARKPRKTPEIER